MGRFSHDLAASFNCPNHRELVCATPALAWGIIVSLVAFAWLTADIGFVGVDDTSQ